MVLQEILQLPTEGLPTYFKELTQKGVVRSEMLGNIGADDPDVRLMNSLGLRHHFFIDTARMPADERISPWNFVATFGKLGRIGEINSGLDALINAMGNQFVLEGGEPANMSLGIGVIYNEPARVLGAQPSDPRRRLFQDLTPSSGKKDGRKRELNRYLLWLNAQTVARQHPDQQAMFVVFARDEAREIIPLQDVAEAEITDLTRLVGLKRLQEMGAKVPEGLTVFGDALFRRWLNQGGHFALEDEGLIRRKFTDLIRQYGPLALRRAFNIPGYKEDPGNIVLMGFTDPNQGINTLQDMFNQACGFMKAKAQEAGQSLQAIVADSQICAFCHDYIDPEMVEMSAEGKILYNPNVRFPAGAFAIPRNRDATKVLINFGFGREKGVEAGASTVVIEFRPDGTCWFSRVNLHQAKMLCLVEGKQGDQELDVPQRLQHEPAMGIDELVTIARAVRDLCQQYGALARIEVNLGNTVEGASALYFTEAIPYKLEREGLAIEPIREKAKVLVIAQAEDIERVIKYLQLHLDENIFVTFPPTVALARTGEGNMLVNTTAKALQEYRERIRILHPTVLGAGHQATSLINAGFKVTSIGRAPFDSGTISAGALLSLVLEAGGWPEITRIIEGGFVNLLTIPHANERVGAKAFNLALLAQMGFTVPLGGVVLPSVLEKFLDQNQLGQALAELRTPNIDRDRALTLAQLIHDFLINQASAPQELLEEIASSWLNIFSGAMPTRIIARSCARMEDGGGGGGERHPFVGVFGSIGNLRIEEAWRGIAGVWGSLFSEEAIRYMLDRNIPLASALSMAVMLQEYFDLEALGGFGMIIHSAQRDQSRYGRISIRVGGIAEIADGSDSEFDPNIQGEIIFDNQTGQIVGSRGNCQAVQGALNDQILPLIQATQRMFQGQGGASDIEACLVPTSGGASYQLVALQARPLYIK